MKKLLLISLLFLSVSAFSQRDISLSVQEINPTDTAFNHHPQSMMIRMESLNATYDTCIVYFETYYESDIDSSVYLTKETFTRGRVRMPFDAFKASFNGDGTINEDVADQILYAFKLKLRRQ